MKLARRKIGKQKISDYALLANFVPLNTLDYERLTELAKHASIQEFSSNSRLFKQGDLDNQVVYLIDGEVELTNEQNQITIKSGLEEARVALDPHQPRQYTATSKTMSRVILLDQNLLDIMLTWDPYAGYIVDEIDTKENQSHDDWMLAILHSEVFRRIPPVKIQSMFQRLVAFPVQKDEFIFQQGDEGDYFYLIQNGTFAVIKQQDDAKTIVTELETGQFFGEDALLSEKPRNASIQALTDGVLLRLSRNDFNELFRENILMSVNYEQALDISSGECIWIDVRQPEEFNGQSLSECINVPLSMLRESLDKIPKDKPAIVCCDTGQRSTCAAYLLCALGYEAYVLENGFESAVSD